MADLSKVIKVTQEQYDKLSRGEPVGPESGLQDGVMYLVENSADYVRYDTASQGLNTTQKSNARINIGAGTSNFSGNYNDLTNKPTIPSSTSQLTNDRFVRYDTSSQGLNSTQKSNARTNIGAGTSNFTGYSSSNKLSTSYISGLSDVATSGSYSDLTDTPSIPTMYVHRINIYAVPTSGTSINMSFFIFSSRSSAYDYNSIDTYLQDNGYTSTLWMWISTKFLPVSGWYSPSASTYNSVLGLTRRSATTIGINAVTVKNGAVSIIDLSAASTFTVTDDISKI